VVCRRKTHPTDFFDEVVSQKSVPAQIRQLILYYYEYE